MPFLLLCTLGCESKPAAPTPAPPEAPSAHTKAVEKPKAAEPAATLKVGDQAPAITLKLQDGSSKELSKLHGEQVLVYFYPKDDTRGCTIEAQGIRDHWEDFKKAGIQVFGVSMQDAASHQSFIDKHKLPFPLVVDAAPVAEAFGVPVRQKQYAARQTFLIGADGKVKAIWRAVEPSAHAREVLAAASKT